MSKLDINILKKLEFENVIEYDDRIVVIILRADYDSELKSRNRSEKLDTIFEEHEVAAKRMG